MSTKPRMSAVVLESAPDLQVMGVEHGDAQSYSRAVTPFAMRTFHAWLREGRVPRGDWALVGVTYDDPRIRILPGSCRASSVYRFERQH